MRAMPFSVSFGRGQGWIGCLVQDAPGQPPFEVFEEEPRSKGLDHSVHAAVVIGMVMADDHQINRLDASLPDQADDLFGWTGIDQCRLPLG